MPSPVVLSTSTWVPLDRVVRTWDSALASARTFSPESLTTVPTEAAKDGVITAVTARIQAASFAVRALDRCMVGFLRSLFTQYRLYRDEGAYLPLSARSSQTAATSIAA